MCRTLIWYRIWVDLKAAEIQPGKYPNCGRGENQSDKYAIVGNCCVELESHSMPMLSCCSWCCHYTTTSPTQPLINMSNPDDLKSVFEDPSNIEMEDLPKPKCTLQLKQSFQSLKSTWTILQQQSSIMAPTVVSQPSLNDITITLIIPTNPLFPPCLWAQRLFHG